MAVANDIIIDAALDSLLGEEKHNVKQVTSNTDEYVTVVSTLTGEEKPILKIDARRVLRKRLPDGSLAHWVPGFPGERPKPRVGTLKCYLHPDFDEADGPSKMDRAWIDSIGLAGVFCNAGNPANQNRDSFLNPLMRDRHMQRRHRDEWAIIQASREAAKDEREAAERRADREAMLAMAGGRAEAKRPAAKSETGA